ncbi:MAG: hypothetical protein ACREXP_00525 [Steroidobacteraceae bacterium]
MTAATDYITSMPRTEQEHKGCIRTFTGLYVNPLQLRPEDIDHLDLAHHLSLICRDTGACPTHYSVAQHSVYVAQAMKKRYQSAEAGLAGLLHDAAEAYFNDIASPVKRDPRMAWYRDLEHEATLMIFEKFGVDAHWLALTKPYDDECFREEVKSWWGNGGKIRPWGEGMSEFRFLQLFGDLRGQL